MHSLGTSPPASPPTPLSGSRAAATPAAATPAAATSAATPAAAATSAATPATVIFSRLSSSRAKQLVLTALKNGSKGKMSTTMQLVVTETPKLRPMFMEARRIYRKFFSVRDCCQELKDVQVKAKLGEGSSGEVFLAQQGKAETYIAVKFVSDVDAAKKEIKILQSISQECGLFTKLIKVVTFQASPPEQGSTITALYLTTIAQQIGSSKDLSEVSLPEIQDIFRSLLQALSCLHNLGICHNDLKEDNFLYCFATKTFMLIDFSHASKKPVFGGTWGYRSPEVVQICSSLFSSKSDIFSCGILLLRFLVGGPVAFGFSKFMKQEIELTQCYVSLFKVPRSETLCTCKGKDAHQAIVLSTSFKNDSLPALSNALVDYIHEDLLAILRACLALNPDKRPTAKELLSKEFFHAENGRLFHLKVVC